VFATAWGVIKMDVLRMCSVFDGVSTTLGRSLNTFSIVLRREALIMNRQAYLQCREEVLTVSWQTG
jgi:hypothetical protein